MLRTASLRALRIGRLMLALAGTLSSVAVAADFPAATPEQEQFFETQVRPLLATKCLECHGAKKQESGLRLDSRAAMLQGGDSGETIVVPGNVEASRLVKAVRRQGDTKMPPEAKDKLTQPEIDVLAKWVEIGLPWPAASQTVAVSQEQLAGEARAKHWSLQPIVRPALPAVGNSSWLNTPVDAFILAKLEAAGISPAPPAERYTLIRRATFDLLGLPPTPEEVDAFNADQSPDAYERLIDRLLSSPRYGERWGRHWLDVARYSDTRGYAFGKERKFPYAYTYRDYVIRALNADLPYDRFVVEQLAADKLPETGDRSSLAALGFLTVGRKFDNMPEDMDEQIDAVTRGFLALTVSCARCHDHKFDPIPTDDYYSLYGVFASTQAPDNYPTIGDPNRTSGYDAFDKELAARKATTENYLNERKAAMLEQVRERVGEYFIHVATRKPDNLLAKAGISLNDDELKPQLIERWRQFFREKTNPADALFGTWTELIALPNDQFAAQAPGHLARRLALPPGNEAGQINARLKAELASGEPIKTKDELARRYGNVVRAAYQEWKKAGANAEALAKLPPEAQPLARVLVDPGTPTDVPRTELTRYLNRAEKEKARDLKKKAEEYEATAPGAPPRAMSVVDSDQPVNPRVLIRGNVTRPGREVPRQFLKVLAGDQRKPFAQGSGRLELAQAIVAPENPLTARVIANRVWLHLFGQALVNTPSDFGLRSAPPTHPELLDYLAARLRESGWSLKSLQREILLSSAYRQNSLGASGGTGPAKDPQNGLVWRMNRKRLDFEPLRDSLFAVAGDLKFNMYGRGEEMTKTSFVRRAVYGFIDRQDLPNLLRVFDFASPDSSSPGRPHTIVPQQALFLMNSPVVVEQAQKLAARPDVSSLAEPEARIARLYQLLYARVPAAEELQLGREFVAAASSSPAKETKLSPWEQYAQLLLLGNEFMYVD